MQNVNEFHDRIIIVVDCVINEMLANTWQRTEYCPDVCHATNGAILRCTEHTLWLKICFILLAFKAGYPEFHTEFAGTFTIISILNLT
jgi:hypothetical protein